MHVSPPEPKAGPRVIAWELTRCCPLSCRHCRASARATADENELNTDACFRVVDSLIAHGSKPLLILTGGEPLTRTDVWDIAKRASDGGLRVVMAPCGASVNAESVRRMLASGVKAISLSMDGATAEKHDTFRGVPGAFAANLSAIHCAREAGLPFQINALVSRETVEDLPTIRDFALREGATQLDLFFLVPVGRGAAMKDVALSAAKSEQALEWAVEANASGPLPVKTTCAPQVVRVRHRLKGTLQDAQHAGRHGPPLGGCMAGRGFAFISHVGILQPCGFFDVPSGDLQSFNYDLPAAYAASEVFRQLQNVDGYGGKCGICEFRTVCGGCRARALAVAGDYLAEEPSCPYRPNVGKTCNPHPGPLPAGEGGTNNLFLIAATKPQGTEGAIE